MSAQSVHAIRNSLHWDTRTRPFSGGSHATAGTSPPAGRSFPHLRAVDGGEVHVQPTYAITDVYRAVELPVTKPSVVLSTIVIFSRVIMVMEPMLPAVHVHPQTFSYISCKNRIHNSNTQSCPNGANVEQVAGYILRPHLKTRDDFPSPSVFIL